MADETIHLAPPTPDEPGLDLELRRTDGDTTLTLRGELDVRTSPPLWRWLDGFAPDGDVRLDLRGLAFLDSTGLGCVLKLNRLATDAGRMLIAQGATPPVRRVLETTGLHRVIAIVAATDGG